MIAPGAGCVGMGLPGVAPCFFFFIECGFTTRNVRRFGAMGLPAQLRKR